MNPVSMVFLPLGNTLVINAFFFALDCLSLKSGKPVFELNQIAQPVSLVYIPAAKVNTYVRFKFRYPGAVAHTYWIDVQLREKEGGWIALGASGYEGGDIDTLPLSLMDAFTLNQSGALEYSSTI